MQSWWIMLSWLIGGLAGAGLAYAYWRGRADDLAAVARGEGAAAAASVAERLRMREEQLGTANAVLAAREQELRQSAEAMARLQAQLVEAQTRLEAEQRQAGEKLKLLDEAKRQLTDQFKVLANEIFEDKSKKFNQASGDRLDTLLKPLGERLVEFAKKVEDTHEKGVRERATIKQLIESLTEKNQLLSAEAHSLTNALRGQVKTQGNWGEMVLERVLDASGLEKGLAYEVQASHLGDDGHRYQPDVVIHLPGGKHIVVDAKVSLVAYERYTAEEADEATRAKAIREHVLSLRNHLKALGDKHYQTLPGLTTPDFVFMFIPIETAHTLALREETTLVEEASKRKIVIVTPSTLLAALFLVNYLWQQEKQSRNAADIAEAAGKLYDKLADFAKALEQVGVKLDHAQREYDQAMKRLSTGRGNALGLAEKIRGMGARTTKDLPPPRVGDEDDEATPALPEIATS